MVQLERHFVFAGRLDRMLEDEMMPIYIAIEFLFQTLGDVVRGNGTESLACFTRVENECDLLLSDAAG